MLGAEQELRQDIACLLAIRWAASQELGCSGENAMQMFTAVIEKCPDTGLYVGYVPNFPGAHSQGETLDELYRNLQEVITMLLEDGEQQPESEFIGTQTIVVA